MVMVKTLLKWDVTVELVSVELQLVSVKDWTHFMMVLLVSYKTLIALFKALLDTLNTLMVHMMIHELLVFEALAIMIVSHVVLIKHIRVAVETLLVTKLLVETVLCLTVTIEAVWPVVTLWFLEKTKVWSLA